MADDLSPDVSDMRLIVELLVADFSNEYLLPEQVASAIHQLSVQETQYRLDQLATESDYVDKREVAGHTQYRLNNEGRDLIRQEIGEDL